MSPTTLSATHRPAAWRALRRTADSWARSSRSLTGSELLAAFGDDEKAVVVYDTETVPVKSAPAAECVTVETARSPTAGSSSTEHPSTPPGSVPADGLVALSCTQILRAVHGTHAVSGANIRRCVGYRPASWISAA